MTEVALDDSAVAILISSYSPTGAKHYWSPVAGEIFHATGIDCQSYGSESTYPKTWALLCVLYSTSQKFG